MYLDRESKEETAHISEAATKSRQMSSELYMSSVNELLVSQHSSQSGQDILSYLRYFRQPRDPDDSQKSGCTRYAHTDAKAII